MNILKMNNKICRKDINDFFDSETEASRISWEALMQLPITERVRRRKAILDVTINREYEEKSPENTWLYKLHYKTNLSDFKEGESLLLHKKEFNFGLGCTLYKFIEDNTIIISIYYQASDLKEYYDESLVLDKCYVDLRPFVFNNFILELPYNSSIWNNLLINKKQPPIKTNIKANQEELYDTIKNFKIYSLTENQKEAIINSMSAKDYYLIQGPPGTGKSFVLGLIILEELLYFRHKVMVIGPNHLAINNVLEQILKLIPQYEFLMKVGQPYNASTLKVTHEDKEYSITNILRLDVEKANSFEEPLLIGLTPHSLYSKRARGLKCDTLIIDEAGQMPIPLALMGMIKAKKVILAGDHKQLPPIILSEEIPEKMRVSIFQHLKNKNNCTMLDISFRMCKSICDFVSELFYEGEVKPSHIEGSNIIIGGEPLYDFNHSIILHNVEDFGEQTSDREAEYITDTIVGLIKRGVKASEIAVLSPFRAQAANIKRHYRRCKNIEEKEKNKLIADTIDKMQGQEREVIIFSLTSGNYEYIKEMADFLYNPNKLNVAFSRAKSKLIIVGNFTMIKTMNLTLYPHISKMFASKLVTFV